MNPFERERERVKYLGAAFSAVRAADELDVASAALVPSSVPPLERLT